MICSTNDNAIKNFQKRSERQIHKKKKLQSMDTGGISLFLQSYKLPKIKKNKIHKHKHDFDYNSIRCYPDLLSDFPQRIRNEEISCIPIPKQLDLSQHHGHGIPFGTFDKIPVGIAQGEEGNTVVIGGPGSGKSRYFAKSALKNFDGAICVTDVKGELSEYYKNLYEIGVVKRPYLIFDPVRENSIGYDPFFWLSQDDPNNLVGNLWEIIYALLPSPIYENEPFWTQSEQALLFAALLYYHKLDISFSDAILLILDSNVMVLCEEILNSDTPLPKDIIRILKFALGLMACNEIEMVASIDRGLRNKLLTFACDAQINHAFRKKEKGSNCFSWDDLDKYNIFIRIPENRIEEWSGAVNLMYTQLIRHLERRPDKYTPEGAKNIQTLLLMDEFARFGKLQTITSAISTLRSKNVNICLIIQSLAQLDKVYSEYDRRIIFDCCSYQAILRVNDADTQHYVSSLIGTRKMVTESVSEHMTPFMDTTGFSRQLSETRELTVFPHELAILKDVLLLTPHGLFRLKKSNCTTMQPEYRLKQMARLIKLDKPSDFSNQ